MILETELTISLYFNHFIFLCTKFKWGYVADLTMWPQEAQANSMAYPANFTLTRHDQIFKLAGLNCVGGDVSKLTNMEGKWLEKTPYKNSRHMRRKVHTAKYDQVTRERSNQILHEKVIGHIDRAKKWEKKSKQPN